MKVYEGQGPALLQIRKNAKKKGPQPNDFKKIMDQINSGSEEKAAASNVNSGPVIAGISVLNMAERVDETLGVEGRNKVVGMLHETLDIVNFYADKLGDVSLSAKGLDPLIDNLEERLDTLKSMEVSPEIPEKLKPIIADMTVTIGTEIAKFRRGDYQ